MNPVHWHLLVNHVSIFGVLFGLMALIWAITKNSSEMRVASTALFLISALFAWIAGETGEGAYNIVQHLPDAVDALMDKHAEAADMATTATIILGIGAILSEVIHWVKTSWVKTSWSKIAQCLLLILALISLGLLSNTALLGGKIRHTEIRNVNG